LPVSKDGFVAIKVFGIFDKELTALIDENNQESMIIFSIIFDKNKFE